MVFEIQRTYNLKNRIGTRGFMAPETIFNYYYQGKGVDIWASGIIFLSFLSKKFPILNMNKFSKINNDVIKEIYPLACIFGKEKIETIAKKYSILFLILESRIHFPEVFDKILKNNNLTLRKLCLRDDLEEVIFF